MINRIKLYKKEHTYLEIIMATFALVGGMVRFFALYDSWYVTNHGLPQELREGVGIKLAVEFAKGNNPYSIAYNEVHNPIINHYGWFTSFFLSVCIRICKLFTVARPEIICTIVTLGVIVLGCFAMWCVTYSYSNNLFLATVGAEIALSCYWRSGLNGGCFPDMYGLTLSFVLMWLIEADNKRKRYRYPLYILIVIMMFYIKQYFALVGVGILIWLMIHDRKVAFKYLMWGLFSGIVSVVVVNLCLPLYFTEALLYSGSTNINTYHNTEYARMQFQVLFESYKPLFIIIICYAVVGLLTIIKSNYEQLKHIVIRYDVIMMLLGGLTCIRLGQNMGAIYSYYLQLWISYVISVSLYCAYIILKRTKQDIQYANVLVMLVLLVAPKVCAEFYETVNISDDNMQNWEEIYSTLDANAGEEETRLLVSDPLSFYAIDHDFEAFDYGVNEYVSYAFADTMNPFFIKLFPRAYWLIERVENYREETRQRIADGYYSCLAFSEGIPWGFTNEYIMETGKYELIYETDLQTGGLILHTYVYVLKDL